MLTIKCRCSNCDELVTESVGDKCVSCYNNTVIQPTILKYDRMLLQESTYHLNEITRLREVELENDRFWSSIVNSYRDRLEVRMVDAAKRYVWRITNFFGAIVYSVHFFLLGGYRKLLHRPVKERDIRLWPDGVAKLYPGDRDAERVEDLEPETQREPKTALPPTIGMPTPQWVPGGKRCDECGYGYMGHTDKCSRR